MDASRGVKLMFTEGEEEDSVKAIRPAPSPMRGGRRAIFRATVAVVREQFPACREDVPSPEANPQNSRCPDILRWLRSRRLSLPLSYVPAANSAQDLGCAAADPTCRDDPFSFASGEDVIYFTAAATPHTAILLQRHSNAHSLPGASPGAR